MKKYIQRGAGELPGSKWHSSPRCKAINPEAKVVVAPESLLRAYNITQKCGVCEARDQREKTRDKELDMRPYLSLLLNLSRVVEKQLEREKIRSELYSLDITYNLRETKLALSRKMCKGYIRAKRFDELIEIAKQASLHWQDRIDKKDLHRPEYFKEMLNRSIKVIKDLEVLKNGKN